MDNRGCNRGAVAMTLWLPLLFPLYVLRVKIGPFPTTVLEIAFVALAVFVTWTNGWRVWRDGCAQTKQWHLPAALWIAATLIAISAAPNAWNALGLWRAYVLEPILYALLLAGTIRCEKDRSTVITALVGAVTFIALLAVLQYISIFPIPHPWNTDFVTRRATGPFPFPNAVSLFCAPIAAMCFGMLIGRRTTPDERRPTNVLRLGFILGTLATILAKSVGGFLAILVTTFLSLIWSAKTRRATIFISLFLVIAIAITPRLRAPIMSSLTFNEWSGKVRLVVWRETWQMLKDRPIFGAGFGAYPDVIKPYHRATAIEIFQYPHNLLLNLWSETGLLGVFAFGWICVIWIRSCVQHGRPQGSPLLPLLVILIHGLVDVPYFKNDLAFLFWTLAILATTKAAPKSLIPLPV